MATAGSVSPEDSTGKYVYESDYLSVPKNSYEQMKASIDLQIELGERLNPVLVFNVKAETRTRDYCAFFRFSEAENKPKVIDAMHKPFMRLGSLNKILPPCEIPRGIRLPPPWKETWWIGFYSFERRTSKALIVFLNDLIDTQIEARNERIKEGEQILKSMINAISDDIEGTDIEETDIEETEETEL